MVYRGKPSAGCENCRKAKKRCTLEQPACSRCVKLKKQCSGYRDVDSLQIQDESEAVRIKASRKARQTAQAIVAGEDALAPITRTSPQTPIGILTPSSSQTDSSSGSDDQANLLMPELVTDEINYGGLDYDINKTKHEQVLDTGMNLMPLHSVDAPITYTFAPTAVEVAKNHFFNQFTSTQHWYFLRDLATKPKMDPCLDLAIKACGMAAVDNIENVGGSFGREYARAMYADALGLLNITLRDPKRCKTDEALIAVVMLGYFENLACDSRESIQSWKAHIAGATQLLKIRGRGQFKSQIGRVLFREIRAQILIHCIWDDLDPPAFLDEWEADLEAASEEFQNISRPADSLAKISFDFAKVRAAIEKHTTSDIEAADICAKIDARLINWSVEAGQKSQFWLYDDMEVADSPHIWNGMVHAYRGSPAPSVWNTYRVIRILVTRSQEYLAGRFQFTPKERQEQVRYFRRVRRQMTDEICAGTPACLGHAPDGAFNSNTILLSAYSCIWPLFFAGTCALERLSPADLENLRVQPSAFSHSVSNPSDVTPDLSQVSAAQAQVSWIWGRLNYISNNVGLKWASGIAGVLKDDFRLNENLLPSDNAQPVHPSNLNVVRHASWAQRVRKAQLAREKGAHKPFHWCVEYSVDQSGESHGLMPCGEWMRTSHDGMLRDQI